MYRRTRIDQPTAESGGAHYRMPPQGDDRPRSEELTILVHGTYAANCANVGEHWWQSGSREAEALQRRLPKHVRVASGSEVFHWSGENGERARSKAAAELLEHLKPLEESNEPYHLIGHSHGGSVIWHALRLATLAKQPLRGLRSWSTVGTPFMHHCSRSPWHIMNVLGVIIGLALIRPAFAAASGLAHLVWDAACGRGIELVARPDSEIGYQAILRAPFLSLLEWLGVPVRRAAEGIYVGGFDPTGDLSALAYLTTTREGLILISVILMLVYVFLHLAILCVRPVIESFRSRAELRLQRRAFRQYGPRWMGLWSPDDEAINGLRATLDLSLSFVKKMAPSERVFLTDSLSLLSRPYYWIFAPIFNRMLRPVIDSMVSGTVIRTAQGNDRPSAHVFAVAASPALEVLHVPSLPEPLSDKILRDANRNAEGIGPKLRQLLSSPSFTSGLESFGSQLSGNELVHTSYFDHGEVLDLLAFNIAWGAGANAEVKGTKGDVRALTHWFHDFKIRVACDERVTARVRAVASSDPDPTQSERQRTTPRRRIAS